ncbi:MAG: amidohydrolase, partial [Cellulomonadaceae bacterium]
MTSILFRGGVVHSPADPFAQALLVSDGVVTWLGADDTADGMADRADRVVELAGAIVTPAFVDAHVHLLATGSMLAGLDLSARAGVRGPDDVLTQVADRAAAVRAGLAGGADGPICGRGWDETTWPDGAALRGSDLDAAGQSAPVALVRVDAHSSLVSSSFADALGLRDLPGWSGNGLVTGAAHERTVTALREADGARHTELTDLALHAAAAAGIVAVHEQSTPAAGTRAGLAELIARTAVPGAGVPLVVGYRGELCADEDRARAIAAEIPGLLGIGGDLCVDGSVGSRTAALRAPYADRAPVHGDSADGVLHLGAEQIAAHLVAVGRAGLQAGFHVIGDRAMDETVAGFRLAVQEVGAGALQSRGHRLEHAEMLDAPALEALLGLGVSLSMQPAFDREWGGPTGMYARRLGPVRAGGMNVFADLAAAGVPLGFGSDTPVTPFDPWGAVSAALWHRSPEQR